MFWFNLAILFLMFGSSVHHITLACDEKAIDYAAHNRFILINNDSAAVMEVGDIGSFLEQLQDGEDFQCASLDKSIVPDEAYVEVGNDSKILSSWRKRKRFDSSLDKDHVEKVYSKKKVHKRQTKLEPQFSIETLPEEIMLMIFSSLNQRDIPSVTGTCERWERLMADNKLWKGYAQKAFIIMKNSETSQKKLKEKDYKALIKDHCTLSFTDLGNLNGGMESCAYGISLDGSVVVGDARDGTVQAQDRAFHWTREEGVQSLGALNGGMESCAYGINLDGSVVVGYAHDGVLDEERAFRWTRKEGMQSLGTLNSGTESGADKISSDGSVIIGSARDEADQNKAFHWTREEGMQSLGTLNGGTKSKALALNFNGSVIVGSADDGSEHDQERAFRWAREEGMQSLGTLNGGTKSCACGVSLDGSVIVGYAHDGVLDEERAFRWTREEGMQSLGTLNDGTNGCAIGVSLDGSVIVGSANDGSEQNQGRAFLWTSQTGMQSVGKLLTDRGMLPSGWLLTSVSAITPSGTVLVGEGQYKDQEENGGYKLMTRAWRAVIPRGNLF